METYTQTEEEANHIAALAGDAGAIYAESVKLPPSRRLFSAPELEREWMVEILCTVEMEERIRKKIQKSHPDVLPPVSTKQIIVSESTAQAIKMLKER